MKLTPLPLTQDEVDALTAGGKPPVAVVRRLRARRTTRRGPKPLVVDKATPARITQREMATIRGKRLPAAIQKRISAQPDVVPPSARPDRGKAAPTKTPADAGSTRA
jgi:hypothetical protein